MATGAAKTADDERPQAATFVGAYLQGDVDQVTTEAPLLAKKSRARRRSNTPKTATENCAILA